MAACESDFRGRRVEFCRASRSLVDEQKEAATRLRRIVEEQKLEVIRLSFPDQHGILRGKTLVASEALASLESGCTITTTMLAKDTSHRTVFPVFTAGGGFGMQEMEGAADVLMVPDPTSFRVLPWAPAHRLAAVRHLFRRWAAGPVRDPQSLQVGAREARAARLRFRRRARGRIPHLQARRRKNVAGGCRPARPAAGSQPAVARLSIPDRAALRPDGAGARDCPARHDGARPAAALDRSRIRPEPVRIHLRRR